MPGDTYICPRCLREAPLHSKAKFCPHCGLPDAAEAAADHSPLELCTGAGAGAIAYSVLDRIAIGSISNIYRCRWSPTAGGGKVEGVFKIARDARTNPYIASEANILRKLHAADASGRFAPFLPALSTTTFVGPSSAADPARQANVLQMHGDIASPDDLYSLAEVQAQYPAGLDPRHVAWIWRRLLNVLGFIHSTGIVHGEILPMHILIEPKEHKLVLIDFCWAIDRASSFTAAPIVAPEHAVWLRRELLAAQPPIAALDLALGARCMIQLMGGDGATGETPGSIDPALTRHFQRCLGASPDSTLGAWKLLDDFDKLIAALWGERKFVVLTMPPKKGR